METAEKIIKALGLEPHPEEGGYFSETYRSPEILHKADLPDRYTGDRCTGTAIYYLLTPTTYSHMHKLESDEIFHFYSGDPCEMLQLFPDGSWKTVILGSDISAGHKPQVIVPRGVWQGMRLLEGGAYGLMGCTVSPGFEYVDYSHGTRAELQKGYPEAKEFIDRLTHE